MKTLHGHMKLGCKRPRNDKRTFKLANYLTAGTAPGSLVLPAPFVDWDQGVNFGMWANDEFGDCTIAAITHMVQRWCNATGKKFGITRGDVLKAYGKVNGGVDQGADPVDVLNLFRKDGIGGHRCLAWAEVNITNAAEVMWVMQNLGGIYYAVDLPVMAQDQKVWDLADQADPKADAGSWGGHMISFGKYRSGFWTCATWGAEKDVTPQWASSSRYGIAGYAIISEDFLNVNGKTPSGFDLARLRADLALVEQMKREQSA